MDLYRILRISMYLLVGSGALSLFVAEHRFGPLGVIILFGAAAAYFVDSQRERPIRLEYAIAFILSAFVYYMKPLQNEPDWKHNFPPAFAHFLCVSQAILFLMAYRGGVLLMFFCACSLSVVLISAMIHPGVSVLPRMVLFVAITVWTLFIHSLWTGKKARSAGELRLPERAFWQGLSMSAMLSAACLLLGTVFFFSAPHVNESFRNLLDFFMRDREQNHETAKSDFPGGPGNNPRQQTGFDPTIRLKDMGKVEQSAKAAIAVECESGVLADKSGRLYLRGSILSRYSDGAWLPDNTEPKELDAPADVPPEIVIADPGVLSARGKETVERVESLSLAANVYFAVGEVTKINVAKVKLDRNGELRAADTGNISAYTLSAMPPLWAEELPEDETASPAALPEMIKTDLPVNVIEEIRRKAQEMAGPETSAVLKARHIESALRDSKRYGYTLNLDEVKRAGDPVCDFVLGKTAEERRGHCGYFASAFVLLCRLNRIPARVATGFSHTLSKEERTNRHRIIFSNADAHAWAEVHFDDIGWVVFDPTPAAPAHPPTEIAANTVQPGKSQADPRDPPIPPDSLEGRWQRMLEFNSRDQHEIYERLGNAIGIGFGGVKSVFAGASRGGWIVAAAAWIVAGIILFWMIQTFLRRNVRRAGRAGSTAAKAQAAVFFYSDLLQALSKRGFVRKPGQTPREFATQVLRRGGDKFAPVMTVTEIFENVRYGHADLNQEEFNRLQNALDSIRELSLTSAALPARS